MAQDTLSWQNFYLAACAAAAALTGLVFVALSLHSKEIMAQPVYRARAASSIESFMAQVLLSAAVLVPQSHLALGLEVALVGVYFFVRTIGAVRTLRAVRSDETPRPRALSVPEWSGWVLWLGVLVASGITLMMGTAVGFYLLALSMLYRLAVNVWNAWVLIAEVSAETGGNRVEH